MSASGTSQTRRFALPLLFIGGVVGAALLWIGFSPDDTESGSLQQDVLDKTFPVARGDFNITVLVDGTLDAIKRHELQCEVRWNDKTISRVVDDRSLVKKGDVIMELDPEPRQKDLERHSLELEEARKELAVAEEDLKMVRASNLSDIKTAADRLRTAREALRKYLDLEYTKKRDDLQAAIRSAEDALESAENDLSVAEENLDANPFNDEVKLKELRDAAVQKEEAVAKAEQAVETALHNYRVFRQYEHPQKLRQLEEAVSQADLNLQQVIVNAKGKVVQAESRINHHKRQIIRYDRDVQNAEKDLANMVIRAPVDGIVTLGNPHRRHWQQPKEYKVGTQLHHRETVATIPDLSSFLVKVDIPEEYRSRVEEGQQASLRSPAIPDLEMMGSVTKIAPMAENVIRWDQGSPKIYPTEIRTDITDNRLMPGMSIKVEIVVETVKNALHVPVEAVYNEEGAPHCRVKILSGAEERAVKTGRTSIHFVEIQDGLEEGDVVYLFRRPGAAQ